MSGSQLVREFRSPSPARTSLLIFGDWRKTILAVGAGASLVAFGAIIVRANDGAGVYDVHKQYAPQRQYARTAPLPQIFVPSNRPVVQTALNYAPVFSALAPMGAEPGAAAPVRGSPRAVKVSPAARDKAFAEGYLNTSTSYCVRSCDGFFFPVGNPASSDIGAHDATCARQCPAAETAVFVAPAGSRGIEDAINRKGERYETIRTAFNHRSQLDKACSCTATGKPRNYSVMNDFTLRKGDLVMSREGMKVFRGEDGARHRTADFARIDLSKLPAAERRSMEAMEAASVRGLALSPGLRARISAQVAAAQPKAPAANPQTRTAQVARKTKGVDGRDLRYVGPDADFDRAR